ncbi:hypothetical protein E4U41_001216, partial [Claviceps citrina]
MAPQILHLPDGKKFSVTPVFGGMGFRSHDHNNLLHPFPAGWMTVLHTEEEEEQQEEEEEDGVHVDGVVVRDDGPGSRDNNNNNNNNRLDGEAHSPAEQDESARPRPRSRRRTIRPFHSPTLQNDTLFLSSISIASSSELKPAASPTREIAMMLWITLY